MTRRRGALAAALVAVAVAVVAALAFGRSVAPAGANVGVSWRGTPVTLATKMFPVGNTRIVQAWLMTNRGGRAFYRLDRSDGSTCFATGKAAAFLRTINAFACSERFPGQEHLLDLSVIGADRPSRTLHVIALIGFATDDVASVGAVDDAGNVIARARVAQNVYMLRLGAETRATHVQAFDAAGAPLGAPQ